MIVSGSHLQQSGVIKLLIIFSHPQTYLWVLNDDSEFDFAFNKLKVAGVMTDYPTKLKSYLENGSGNEMSELIKRE